MTLNDDINEAVKVLKAGGIILYPTDTVWGIGCDATCREAVERIYTLKKRPENKAMLVLLSSADDLKHWFHNIPTSAYQLIDKADKPLTLILPFAQGVAEDLVSPSDGSLGVRITSETFSNRLIEELGKPLVSTSANISGDETPSIFKEISEDILNGVDYVVSYRRDDTTKANPSSIIKLSDNKITIIRK